MSTSSRGAAQPSPREPLPLQVIFKILQKLPTASLFSASLVCTEWRNLIFSSGPRSQALLKRHLSVLRERFGEAEIPHKLPIPTVRRFLTLFAKQELFGNYCSTSTYDTEDLVRVGRWKDHCPVPQRLRRVAICGSLLAVAMPDRRIHVFELHKHPLRLLTSVKVSTKPIAIAVSERYLAVLDDKQVHLFSLVARFTPTSMTAHVYSIRIPDMQDPLAIALTPDTEKPPLVAVLGTSLYLVHPSQPLVEKRHSFFREDAEKSPASSVKTSKSSSSQRPQADAYILETPVSQVGATFPMQFTMHGRQLTARTSLNNVQRCIYLGSAWSNEDSLECSRRKMYGLKDGQDILRKADTSDALWRHFRSQTAVSTSKPLRRWHPKFLDTAEMEIESAVHLYDSFYIVTDAETGYVRIVSVAPFEARFILYQRTESERLGRHPGYAACPGVMLNGYKIGGYIACCPKPGRLLILPLTQIPWDLGQGAGGEEMLDDCREIDIGPGEILNMVAGKNRVVIVFETRVVVVRLWTEKVGGVKDEEGLWVVEHTGEIREAGQEPSNRTARALSVARRKRPGSIISARTKRKDGCALM